MTLVYGSVCSGIEAASVAWEPLGWRPSFLSEIEKFPRAVLKHHFPHVPLHGDFTMIEAGQYDPIDLLVGGTPCQDFSIAGLRAGLSGERGNLTLDYLRLARRLRPRWLVWENVPGVLSQDGGRAFGAILGGMVELGYGVAYRVLDAQHFGVPQRRRRVFVVGYLGDWRRAGAVLFERHSLQGHPPPRREAGKIVAAVTADGVGTCGADDNQGQARHLIAGTVRTHTRPASNSFDVVTHSLRGEGFDASEDGTGRGTPLIPVAFGGNNTRGPIDVATALSSHGGPHGRLDFESETFIAFDTTQITNPHNRSRPEPGNLAPSLAAGAHPPALAFSCKDYGADAGDTAPTLRAMSHAGSHANGGGQMAVAARSGVRRLTPRECERLQGVPDDWTAIPGAKDGPRYKALGNSMAVVVMRWLGGRIQMVEDLPGI